MEKRVLLAAAYSVIEPLGILHLSSVAKEEGWEVKIALSKKRDFSDLDGILEEFKPSIFGVTVYTGTHKQFFLYCKKLKEKYKDLIIVVGGPHATYFPEESLQYADYVVISEGFNSFRKILKGEVKPGIIHLTKLEKFPVADRETFYQDYLEHKKSPIKSIITQTGCPYNCTYCYNSSSLEDIRYCLSPSQHAEMGQTLYPLGKLFPRSIRSVDEIIKEVADILRVSPETKMIYFQDDIFVNMDYEWIKEFHKKFTPLCQPFHAQIRWEFADPNNPKNKEKLELIREAGCTGLTIAIESGDNTIRKEVLNRHMDEDLMFRVLKFLNELGFKVRTEQMLGLPLGATTEKTPINLDADLKTLELNIRLKEKTGLPTFAWASIFAPYKKTKIGDYCLKHGFYSENNQDIPTTFFERSILNFPREWVGPLLSHEMKNVWMSENEQEEYKDKLQLLRDLFNYFASISKGHKLAKEFLEEEIKSYQKLNVFDYRKRLSSLESHGRLSIMERRHLYDSVLYEVE